ncbi:hypothetical protein [Comamonas resistens]
MKTVFGKVLIVSRVNLLIVVTSMATVASETSTVEPLEFLEARKML